MQKLSDFKTGDRVQLGPDVLHKTYAGVTGTVKKTVKRRNVIVVVCDDGKSYDAYPENVIIIQQE